MVILHIIVFYVVVTIAQLLYDFLNPEPKKYKHKI